LPPQDIISGLEKDYFRKHSPATIISTVGTITLAVISTWTQERLDYLGWTNNPIIDILYSMTSAGVWVARTDASGQQLVVESNSAGIIAHAEYMKYDIRAQLPLSVAGTSGNISSDRAEKLQHKVTLLPATLANGALSNFELVPQSSPAGYYGIMKILGVFSSAAVNGDTITLDFQDEDDNALTMVPASWDWACVATTVNVTWKDLPMWKGTDDKALEVDMDTGGGAGDNGTIVYFLVEYWYET